MSINWIIHQSIKYLVIKGQHSYMTCHHLHLLSIIPLVKISSYTDIIFTLWVPFPKSNFFITHSTLFFSSSRTFSNHFWHSATFINKFCLCVSTFLFGTCICCYRAQPLPCISNLDNGKTSLQLGGCFLFQDHLNFFI